MITLRARHRPGHPWIFSNEILEPPVKTLPPGGAVRVVSEEGKLLGIGYCNPHSLISVRLMGWEGTDPDSPALYRERLAAAMALRERLVPGRTAYRLCAGEADRLPGLIIDRFGAYLSVQITTLGMEQRKPMIAAALQGLPGIHGAILKNDAGVRALEGLDMTPAVWFGEVPAAVGFEENGVAYEAELLHGQKTGFFFDQAENRAFMQQRVQGARVLDAFAHLGGWALAALKGGAREAVTIDVSGPACEGIRRNAALNGVSDRLTALQGDAREVMSGMQAESFDVVCVDPPAFAKNRKLAGKALGAYKQVNAAALRLVKPGGLFFTSSCSHHIEAERFQQTIEVAARAARREIVLIRRGGQAPDHPILPGVPETEYLKHLAYAVR